MKRKLVIATPVKDPPPGSVTKEFWKALPEHYRKPIEALGGIRNFPFEVEVSVITSGGVARARNRRASQFFKEGNPDDLLFFVDLDLKPDVGDYLNVLRHDLEVWGGIYTTRQANGHWVMNAYPGAVPQGPLLQVCELGTGFKCYRHSALKKISDRNPWLEYTHDVTRHKEWGFFSMGPVKDDQMWPGITRWLTEDYWLDWLTRDAQIPIYIDHTVKLKHYDDRTGNVYPEEFPPSPAGLPEERPE